MKKQENLFDKMAEDDENKIKELERKIQILEKVIEMKEDKINFLADSLMLTQNEVITETEKLSNYIRTLEEKVEDVIKLI